MLPPPRPQGAVVIGHGFGLDPSTMAEVMLAALRATCCGARVRRSLKVKDTIVTKRLDISTGSIRSRGPRLGLTLDEKKLEDIGMN